MEEERVKLTIFLKHDHHMTLSQIDEKLKTSNFFKVFPPEGVEVVSWYVMMGIGQVVTLSVPPSKVRAVNLAIEGAAWGAFDTEFYLTYDFMEVWKKKKEAS